eukprot:TRINITY_DN3159_c0_g1_i1.p1 TRINITY_DN3159_c0_g1~~TRINITY_DN3159_c0_g1_i1.p1  ORF type:complete len:282 (-),score=34.35 TRINITY_DN3159_c0_g1_i1:116-961(-)
MTAVRVTLATFNIRNTTDRYFLRSPMIADTVVEMAADVLGLQEVAFEQPHPQTRFLASALKERVGEVRCHNFFEAKLEVPIIKPTTDPDFRIDGNATIVHSNQIVSVLKHESLVLSPQRTVQRVLLQLQNNTHLWFINCHLHHVIKDMETRREQIEKIVEWMAQPDINKDHVQVLVGDFNAPPFEPAYALLESCGFQSSYKTIHGSEPESTFPTALVADTMDTDPPGCFDYVWIRNQIPQRLKVTPLSATITGDKPHPSHSPPVCPSDHVALYVTTEFSWL